MCLEEGAATKRGKVEDRNTGFRGHKDIKNIFKVGGFKDRKTKRQKLLGANARTERQKL